MTILEFKTRKQQFTEWLKDVEQENFDKNEIQSALFIWELPPTKKGFQATHCRFNCDLEQLKWFHRELGEYIKEREFDKFLKDNIQDYIKYIE